MAAELKPLVLNMGPQHPSTHGVLRLVLELDGETVVSCEPVIGYLHTGIEKTAENLTYNQAVTVIDRMDYLSPLTNNLAYIMAVEQLLGVEVPKRTQYIRVMFSELSRMGSHLVWLGTSAMELGAMSVFFYCFRMRERILDLIEMASGARMNPSYFRAGGLMHDLPDGWEEKARAFVDEFPTWLKNYKDLLDLNILWVDRMRGSGRISREDALSYGLTGPNLRATGLALDLRKAKPYSSYEEFEFEVPTGQNGDAYDRYAVRMKEMEESRRIIRQGLDRLPKGPWHIDDWRIFPPEKSHVEKNMEALIYHFKLFTEGFKVKPGDAYAAVEGPKGEIGCYVVADGTARPMRVRVRPPSFYNVQALPPMVHGQMIPDLIATVGSVDFVLGEVDR